MAKRLMAQSALQVVAQHRTSSACRNIKFSPSPVDLLAFSEHENFCHIIDARSLSSQSSSQQLRVPQTSSSPVEVSCFMFLCCKTLQRSWDERTSDNEMKQQQWTSPTRTVEAHQIKSLCGIPEDGHDMAFTCMAHCITDQQLRA